ncbi:MAG: FAD-dependent oxidoreductase [Clostridia bacterium]|nr:FAD-dependent oxidoreductase [Clostridia bacterium]
MKNSYEIVVIGGGPAGLAAAIAAYDNGAKSVLVLEREEGLGGILNQCIHNGFGLARFKESLSGPEYAERFIAELKKREIEVLTGTTVLSVSPEKTVVALNAENGEFSVQAKAVILAMGCRERSKGALNIAGTRPAGLFSAGAAQKFVNIKGYMPGQKVVILGSGDIGLIMARRMTLEGAKVLAVFDIMPYSSGLKRNVVQCLEDFGIPLYLNHTIVKIEGEERVSAIVAAEVDENRKPIAGTEKRFECDTVLFSVGLIPENELSKSAGVPLSPLTKGAIVYQNRETLVSGVFACGNVLQVHDLVDFVSEEAEIAGKAAAEYVRFGESEKEPIDCVNGGGVSYVLPQKIDKRAQGKIKLFFRVRERAENCSIVVRCGEEEIARRKKRVVAPGEMETFILTEEQIKKAVKEITVSLEK